MCNCITRLPCWAVVICSLPRIPVQLYYQIALIGRRDLALAPDPRGGFEMVMLRMLAFRPVAMDGDRAGTNKKTDMTKDKEKSATSKAGPVPQEKQSQTADVTQTENWPSIIEALKITGMVRELAANCVLVSHNANKVELLLDAAHEHLRSKNCEKRLEQGLQAYYSTPVKLEIKVGQSSIETPALQRTRNENERYQAALKSIESDDTIKTLRDTFGARIIPDTIQPVD